MKVNFKRMITVLAATAMCAVPMTSAMSASAAPDDSDGFDMSTEYVMVSKNKQSKLEEELRKIKIEAFQASIADRKKVDLSFPEREPDPKPDYSRVKTGIVAGGKGYLEGYNKDMVCETIVMPETKIVVKENDSACETIIMPETKIVVKGGEYLNAYNQIAGHAIKTTTVGVNV